jgi:hypothetical protein
MTIVPQVSGGVVNCDATSLFELRFDTEAALLPASLLLAVAWTLRGSVFERLLRMPQEIPRALRDIHGTVFNKYGEVSEEQHIYSCLCILLVTQCVNVRGLLDMLTLCETAEPLYTLCCQMSSSERASYEPRYSALLHYSVENINNAKRLGDDARVAHMPLHVRNALAAELDGTCNRHMRISLAACMGMSICHILHVESMQYAGHALMYMLMLGDVLISRLLLATIHHGFYDVFNVILTAVDFSTAHLWFERRRNNLPIPHPHEGVIELEACVNRYLAPWLLDRDAADVLFDLEEELAIVSLEASARDNNNSKKKKKKKKNKKQRCCNTAAAATAAAADDDDTVTCTVCLDKPREQLLMPCKHVCVCTDCGNNVEQCPLCRVTIAERVRVFL